MRIALVHLRHAQTGGTERYLNQLASFLAERDHDVTVVCRSHEDPPHPAVRFRVLRDFALGSAWRAWAFARSVQKCVEKEGFDLVYALGRTWSHDVIRLGGGCHQTYLDLAHEASRPRRGSRPLEAKHRMVLRLEERALAPGAYHRVVTNSDMVRDDAQRRFGIPAEAIETIYNGVDLDRFDRTRWAEQGAELRKSLGFGAEERVVLFLGSGYGRKGLDLVLKAFPALNAAHPEARLVVVGFDNAWASYETQARELGIGDVAHFLGGRRDAEVCYAASDLYVLPTRYDPFANSTLEALASGLPVVTSTTNGGAELIESGVQGSVIEVDQGVEALTEALRQWIDPATCSAGAKAARALAERHGHDSKLQRTEELLREVASQR